MSALRESDGAVPPQSPVHPFRATFNAEAIIPPQCYTKTEGRHNPCYVCHQNAKPGRVNVMNDGDLQLEYSFSDLGQTNHWRNLFEDRRERMAQISDAEIIDWINQDNYSALPRHLEEAEFMGWVPDLDGLQRGAAAFDADGFAKDGSHWVAFNYKPMPSTFWPTNGAADDVMIRLPAIYRETADGRYDRNIYQSQSGHPGGQHQGLGADLHTAHRRTSGGCRLGPQRTPRHSARRSGALRLGGRCCWPLHRHPHLSPRR